jgi:hypothetical protein
MSDAAEAYRDQARLSLEIASVLSDPKAADEVRQTARRYIRKAEALEARADLTKNEQRD